MRYLETKLLRGIRSNVEIRGGARGANREAPLLLVEQLPVSKVCYTVHRNPNILFGGESLFRRELRRHQDAN